jgi:thiamine-monophosphate kinase
LIATGGNDYEILATVKECKVAQFESQAAVVGVAVTRIGRIRAEHGVTICDQDGQPLSLDKPGYDHF